MESRSEKQIVMEMIEEAKRIDLLGVDDDFIAGINENGVGTENQYVLDLNTHAVSLAKLDRMIADLDANIDVRTASGEYLDKYGALLGVARVPSLPARLSITITLDVAQEDLLIIPRGTRVLFNNLFDDDFILSYDVEIPEGVTEVSCTCEREESGYIPAIPPDVAVGIEGYPTFTASNTASSTNGSDIEEDDAYRGRLLEWSKSARTGTKTCITDYLEQVDFINDYALLPLVDGVGTLEVVVEGLTGEVSELEDGLNARMLITDEPVIVSEIEEYELITIVLYVHKTDDYPNNLNDNELMNMISTQSKVFISGGYKRDGTYYRGLHIGETFRYSQLVQYLLNQIPEVDGITTTETEENTVAVNSKFMAEDVEVTFV